MPIEVDPVWPDVPALADPMKALVKCRTRFVEAEAGYQKRLHKVLGRAARIAHALDRDHRAWKKFVRDPFWEGTPERYRPKAEKETLASTASYVIRSVMNAHSGSLGQRAWKYAHVLDYLNAKRISPLDVADEIARRGGIEAVHRAATEVMPRREPKELAGLEDLIAAHPLDDICSSTSAERDNGEQPPEEGVKAAECKDDKRGTLTICGKRTMIQAAFDIPPGRTANLRVRRPKGGTEELRLEKVSLRPKTRKQR
jgi:hypothetical protein